MSFVNALVAAATWDGNLSSSCMITGNLDPVEVYGAEREIDGHGSANLH